MLSFCSDRGQFRVKLLLDGAYAYKRIWEIPDTLSVIRSPCTHRVVGVVAVAPDSGSQEIWRRVHQLIR